ncbi:MAG TPA: HDOD domain-containing protein [Thermotogaceae bacterium]|nr:HDOD domain-containing protein [Thermotogaceae bacterium]
MIDREELTRRIESLDDLPTLNFIHQKVINVANNPASSAADLAKVISLDPSLSSRVLKLSNSAYYGFPRKVTSISQAVTILGFKTVKNLAIGIMVYDNLFKNRDIDIDMKKLWEHSINVAIFSEVIGEELNYPNKEELFICGLLHDIGKAIWALINPNILKYVLKVCEKTGLSFYEVEIHLDIPSHQTTGEIICRKWNFPEIITLSVGNHHTPSSVEDVYSDVVDIVHVADLFSNAVFNDLNWYPSKLINEDAWNSLKLKPSMVIKTVQEVKKRFESAKDFLNI